MLNAGLQGALNLEHLTLGIRHRELVGSLPLTTLGVTAGGAKIQQTAGSLEHHTLGIIGLRRSPVRRTYP